MNTGSKISKELYAKIINLCPYAILVAKIDGKFVLWNDFAYKLFKKELTTSPQDDWVDDWGCYNVDKTTKYATNDIPLSRALRGETINSEKMYLSKAGKEDEGIYLKISAFPVIGEDHTLQAGVVICEDVTKEQKLIDNVITKFNDMRNYLEEIINTSTEEIRLHNCEKTN